ncbi:hypothetical protein HDV06_006558 [Boothiomyces sp. JEL0866]|nr:hypothetical protein HDV06_006558 [Boothiomyces sp. JEL0866]
MGSGKTDCSLIIFDNMKHLYRKCVFLLKGDTPEDAIKTNINSWLERYKKIKTEEEKEEYINNYFVFTHFQIFSKECEKNYNKQSKLYENCMFVVDEVHNLRINATKNVSINSKLTYDKILTVFTLIRKTLVILMTGTPMYDQADELYKLLCLLHANDMESFKRYQNIDFTNDKNLISMMKNKISYFDIKGDELPTLTYATTEEGRLLKKHGLTKYDLVVIPLKKDSLQYKQYISVASKHDSFSGKTKTASVAALAELEWYDNSVDKLHDLMFETSDKQDIKLKANFKRFIMDEVLTEINNEQLVDFRLIYIFCELVQGNGIEWLAHLLHEIDGYEIANTSKTLFDNDGNIKDPITEEKRILLISTKYVNKDNRVNKLLSLFNKKSNSDGKYIKIIIGSNITGEAMTLKNVRNNNVKLDVVE